MEIASRELDSRLLIAVLAMKRGFEVVLGQKWLIERNIEAMPAGFYLSKTLTQRDARVMTKARKCGYLMAAIEEELPGIVAAPDELRWVSEEAVATTDLIFVSGSHNTSSMRVRFPKAASHIRAVLNPRWDMLRPQLRDCYSDQAAEIRKKYGPFILINSNLGLTNSEKGTADELIRDQVRLGKLSMDNRSHVEFINQGKTMEAANRVALHELMRRLPERYPQYRIVLRPHPSERLDTWINELAGNDRVSVVRDGAAAPWILAAEMLLHTNCTTGVEAIGLDKPAICLVTIDADINTRYLANRVNPVARSVDEVLDLVAVAATKGCDALYSPEMYRMFRESMSFEDDHLGADFILDRFEELSVGKPHAVVGGSLCSRWRPGRRYVWDIDDKNVRATLFPELDHAEIEKRIRKLCLALDISLVPLVQDCGSNVVLIGERRLSLFSRLRRKFTWKRKFS
nr:surface carbohydrate biosynthesis protein [uncultured Dongia sp.]